MKTIYAIAEAKILGNGMTVGAGYPFVNEMYTFSDPTDAILLFNDICIDLNLEVLHESLTGKFPFAHAVGIYNGEKISLTLHTLIEESINGGAYDFAT